MKDCIESGKSCGQKSRHGRCFSILVLMLYARVSRYEQWTASVSGLLSWKVESFFLITYFLIVLRLFAAWGLFQRGLPTWWRLWSHSTGSRCTGFSSCRFSSWVSGSAECGRTQWLWCMGLSALPHVESSQTRDQTRVHCIRRQILFHWTTAEVVNCGLNLNVNRCPHLALESCDPLVVALEG